MSQTRFKNGFWGDEKGGYPPPSSINYPNEYNGESKACIACTQLLIPRAQQKRITNQWIELLPRLQKIEMLWFPTRVPQMLFDSACKHENLSGLKITWSSIKSLDSIKNLSKLKYLYIGSSAGIESIEPLTNLENLEVLFIENFKKISDFSSLKSLSKLKVLSIEGGMYTMQKVHSLEFISNLSSLEYLSIVMVSCPDKRIEPILKLKNLVTLNWCLNYTSKDKQRLIDELPNLKNLPDRYDEHNRKMLEKLIEEHSED